MRETFAAILFYLRDGEHIPVSYDGRRDRQYNDEILLLSTVNSNPDVSDYLKLGAVLFYEVRNVSYVLTFECLFGRIYNTSLFIYFLFTQRL